MAYVSLDRSEGPACPGCGCRDCELLACSPGDPDAESPWNQAQGRLACRHCGREFRAAVEVAAREIAANASPAVYGRTACPHCRSTDTVVTRTVRPIRYHSCRACLQSFKSYERA